MKQACIAMLALAVLTLGACKTKSELRSTGAAAQSAFQMTLTTEPSEVKDDRQFTMRVKILDQAGKPVADANVHGSLTMTTMDMGKNEFDFAAKGDGNYEAVATADMAGPWEIKVSAKRGADVGEKSFPVVVKE